MTLVNANMTEQKPKFITHFFSTGKFRDYEPQWYANVGKMIVQTMAINSIMPYVGLFTAINIPKIMRWLDSSDPYKTKKDFDITV